MTKHEFSIDYFEEKYFGYKDVYDRGDLALINLIQEISEELDIIHERFGNENETFDALYIITEGEYDKMLEILKFAATV